MASDRGRPGASRGRAGQASLWESHGMSYEYRQATDEERPPCADPAVLRAFQDQVARGEHCADLEDESKVKSRGFFVIRDAVPADELEKMFNYV